MSQKKREKQVAQEMAEYERDLTWVIDNYDELVKDYANEYVAVLNRTVVEYASRIEDLVEKLRCRDTQEMSRILVEFIYEKHPNFVL